MNNRPNVIMIVVDQMRRDALSINRPGFSYTPHLDQLSRQGVNFNNAYTSCPSCIAARATLLTGLKPERTGFIGYASTPEWKYPVTIASVLGDAGYQTQCIGKMHVEPPRNRMGFDNVILHDGFLHDKRQKYDDPLKYDDYLPDVRRDLGPDFDLMDTDIGCNGYATRCWPWGEKYHPTNWVTTKSLEFLRRRDPTKPFFLKLSYHRPHCPLDPPESYFDMYRDRPMPKPQEGDWDHLFRTYPDVENPIPEEERFRERARKAYCALCTHIDFELNRLFSNLGTMGLWSNTAVLFVADHGDMLFDHGVVRKSLPFEGSAAVPLLLRLPYSQSDRYAAGTTDNRLVELRDILPTICDICGIEAPKDIDGVSILDSEHKHEYIHGEHLNGQFSNQWLTDGHEKYCWFSRAGFELFFDLDADPDETHDLSKERPERVAFWRERMVQELKDRPEPFVKDGKLQNGFAPDSMLPWVGVGK